MVNKIVDTIEHLLEQQYIYTITTIRIEKDNRSARCVGWAQNDLSAINIVTNNYGDINESGYYQYAVIEKIGTGLYCTPEEEFWFEWNDPAKKYYPIRKPKEFENVVNFSMG